MAYRGNHLSCDCDCCFRCCEKGIEAGKAAGMRTVAVKDDFSEAEWEKKKEMADYYIEDYDELCDSLSDK